MSWSHEDPESPAGRTGQVVTAIPGGVSPGEVRVAIRGGTELFLAYCDSPVEPGTAVLVVEDLGGRAVRVFAD